MSDERQGRPPSADGMTVWRSDWSAAQNRRCWGVISAKSALGGRVGTPPAIRCRFTGTPVEGAEGLWCRHHRDQAVPPDPAD